MTAPDKSEKSNFEASHIEALCAAKGMRMTEQRRVIARVLANSADHPDVEELYKRCVKVDDRISISTVYRTVKLFEDAGIIERHDFREGRSRYEQAPESHHDHLINLRTGDVIEFRSEEIERLQTEIARKPVPAPAGSDRDGENFGLVVGEPREDESGKRASDRDAVGDDVAVEQQRLYLLLTPAAAEASGMQGGNGGGVARPGLG